MTARPPAGLAEPVDRCRLCAAAIAIAVILAWANSFSAPFELDDHGSILGNASLQNFLSFHWLFPPATGGETVSGRPMLNFSFAVNHALGGLDVRGYHAVNLLIHVLAALTLFGLVRRTLERRAPASTPAGPDANWFALAAVLLWALHPLQTAAVTYLAQRAESLAGLFYLLTLYCFVRAAAREESDRRWALASVVACLLGMATKETMATAPLVVLLYDRAFLSGSFRAAWRARWRLHAALAATWLLLAALVILNRGRGGSAGPGSPITAWTYLLTQAEAIPHYLALVLWPRAQVFDYGVTTAAGLGAVWPQGLFLLALAAFAGWALWRNRAVGFLGACFFLLLAPSSSFVPVATQTMAEHRLYLALSVPILLAGLAVAGVSRRVPRWAGALVAIVVVALGLATFARNRVYGSELALWQDTAGKRPENPRAHHNLGLALAAAGRTDEAMAEFRRAIELQPNHAFAHLNLAAALLAKERWAEAAAHLSAALAAAPDLAEAHYHLGRAREKTGAAADAKDAYLEAIRLKPDWADAHLALGNWQAGHHDAAGAGQSYRTAMRLDPGSAEARFALGNVLAQQRNFDAAMNAYREALAIDPAHVQARNNLGNCQLVTGRFREAIATYEQVLQLRPDDPAVRRNLALARESGQ